MKNIKPIAAFIFLVLFGTSCIDDIKSNEPNDLNYYNITGIWEYIDRTDKIDTLARIEFLCANSNSSIPDLTVQINEDGTGQNCYVANIPNGIGYGMDSITWTTDGDTLFWNYFYANQNFKFTLEFIDDDTFVLFEH